ncbi:hypothetical protein SCB49_09405 [unidentified eubacterium SCB49]|nr:hypothetical protein SCB49_09405 [unidentified eubacterium SCB49]
MSYVFKHICVRILGVEISFTSSIDAFISHQGPKASYGAVALGNELFFQSHGILEENGVEDQEVSVKPWDDTIGFFAVSNNSALPFDVFAASFYLLSRYEEYLPHVKDSLGRYPSKESLAYKNQFLKNPVVDIWAQKLKDVFVTAFPEMEFQKKETAYQLFIQAEEPFKYRTKGLLRTIFSYSADFFGGRFKELFNRTRVILRMQRDPYDYFKYIITASRNANYKVSFFFKLGEAEEYLNGVTTYKNKFKETVKYVADYTDVGLVLSINAQKDIAFLKKEKSQLEEIILQNVKSSYNAAHIVDLPHTYRTLVEMEIKQDFTMCYANKPGFRASTCTPFLFYDLDYEIKTPLIIVPVAGVSSSFNHFKQEESREIIRYLQNETQKVQGHFVIVSVMLASEIL